MCIVRVRAKATEFGLVCVKYLLHTFVTFHVSVTVHTTYKHAIQHK